ncbi:MAG: GIY-YIG nuclease family protein [Ghiorsea sp.]
MRKAPCVYILAHKKHGTLYIGVTSNLVKRIWQHKYAQVKGFTATYHVHTLVYYEQHGTMASAILREKQMKKWNRAWKIRLIEEMNKSWDDLWDSIQL